MRRISLTQLTAAALAAALLAPCAAADEPASGGDVFQLGLQAVYLEPRNPVGNFVNMSGKVYGEISAEWFLDRSWSTELAIGVPSSYSLTGYGGIGIRLMPFTWTGKYRFLPGSNLRPYLGAGVQYTHETLLNVGQSTHFYGQNTAGFVAQGGVELRVAPTWSLDADIRYLGGLEPNDIKIDPLLYSVGIIFRW